MNADRPDSQDDSPPDDAAAACDPDPANGGMYRAFFEIVDQGVALCELVRDESGTVCDYQYLAINPAGARVLGLPQSRLAGQLRNAVFSPDPAALRFYAAAVESGASQRSDFFSSSLGAWFDLSVFPMGGDRFAVLFENIDERKLEERNQAFLVQLNDTLRPLLDAAKTRQVALQLLRESLQAARVFYADFDRDGRAYVIRDSSVRTGVPARLGRFPSDLFPETFRTLARGETLVIEDVRQTTKVDAVESDRAVAAQIGAVILVPLFKEDQLVALLGVHETHPRHWTQYDIELVEETAERTWAAVERAQAETALRESEIRFRTLFESIDEGYAQYEICFDADGAPVDVMLVECNPAFLKLMRHEVDPSGQRLNDLEPGFDRDAFDRVATVLKTRAPIRYERYNRRLRRWFDVFLAPGSGPVANSVISLSHDITERKQLEEVLQQEVAGATHEIRALSRRLLEAHEEERRHLALELHDEIGQTLTGLALQLGIGESVQGEQLKRARQTLSELTEQVRQLSMELRPATLERFGLETSLRILVERLRTGDHRSIAFSATGLERRFSHDVEIAAYRIVQEALTNAIRHSDASEISVQLLASDGVLSLAIHDNGNGFDPATIVPGSGLGGMRERAELLGGSFSVDVMPGDGVLLSAELPYSAGL